MTKALNLKRLILTALTLFMCLKSFAQPPSTASLLVRLKHSPADTSRINIYKALIVAYRNEKPDSAVFFAKQGLAFASTLSYPMGVGLMHGQLGAIDIALGKIDSAKFHLKTALSIFEKINYQQGLVVVHNSLGIVFAKTAGYKESAQNFLAALKINQARNDVHGLVQSYLKLGALNEQINNLDKALEYQESALKLNTQLPPSNSESYILNNIGIIYAKKGQMKEALQYFLNSVKKAHTSEPELMAMIFGNVGDAYQQLGNTKKAFDYQNEALAIARKLNLAEAEATTLVNLASLKTTTKPDTALILLKQALLITQKIQQHHVRLDAYAGLIEVYKQQGNYKATSETLEKRDALKDSLFTLKNSKDIADLIANNELVNSKIKVKDLQLSAARSKLQTGIILAVAICAIIVLIIVVLFYSQTKDLNTQLLHQQEELKSLNNFKDKLFSIISHDLRSPIATIVNLLSVLEDDVDMAEIKIFIPRLKQHSQSTLDVMDKLLIWGQTQLKGAIHEKVHFNVKDLIVQSLHLNQETADQKKIKLIDNTPGEVIICADSSHVEFVIRNLLANAVKFTHTDGFVEISALVGEPAGYSTIAIKDNGIGVDKSLQAQIFEPGNRSIQGTESEKGNSIGLMLCKEFVERNGGKIWVESELGKGTCFYVSFQQ
ncbi:tetratricopeptide repeat protein [Mucilaginibacter sp. dw_454]|uniref:tetratricopeptide repeat-containing sensor histidine kinase n=1 Tax=Mucilaginibacter sp. dw_454 TaxID=2720079 RepID=UPI001BD33D87|nr:tetratricopeptide repeat protein [Mucilaginibacter sp. dw_454]